MGVKGVGENLVASQTSETISLPNNRFIGNSALFNNTDANAVRFLTERFVGNQAQQDDLQQEAQQLIEKHTSKGWFGWLDNDALGKELAQSITTRPELAKTVFGQLSASGRLYTAQAMIDRASDELLTKAAQSETGKQVLLEAKQAFSNNIAYQKSWGEFFASKEKVAADESRIQRIDRAITEAANMGDVQKTETAGSNSEFKNITEDQLLKIAPTLKKNPAKLKEVTDNLYQTMRQFKINTPLKQAMFLATVAQESGELKFVQELPSKYASSQSTYKGRGYIQITHEENYRAFGEYIGKGDLFVKKPELLANKEYVALSAGWFWSEKLSGQYKEAPNSRIGDAPRADLMDFREAAGLVNGGQRDRLLNHWGTRLKYYQRALKAMNIPISGEMQKNLDEQIQKYQGKNHLRRPEQSWWDSPAGKKDPLRKKYGIK